MRNVPPGIQTMFSAGGREGAETGIASCVAISVTSASDLRADLSRHPGLRNPIDRTAKDHIGQERERQNDDNQLRRIDAMENKQLVYDLHEDAKRDHARYGLPSFAKQVPPFAWPGEDRPEVRGPFLTRVNDAITRRKDQRHQRLQHEAE